MGSSPIGISVRRNWIRDNAAFPGAELSQLSVEPLDHLDVATDILAYLFPREADYVRSVGKEAGDSRIWAGIHFPIDNVAGVELGRAVAQKVIAWAETDGSK